MLTAERLRELMTYHPETGLFTYLIRRPRSRIVPGTVRAGSLDSCGYPCLDIDGKRYKAHRLAWLWMTGSWPEPEIDHRNGDPSDNRWVNLREATSQQNKRNRAGVAGVSFDKSRSRGQWMARVSGRTIGRFSTREEALAARQAAAQAEFGEFVRH
jgi:hypothetical protein